MIELFRPPKPSRLMKPEPSLVHLIDQGTLTPSQARKIDERQVTNLSQYLRNKRKGE